MEVKLEKSLENQVFERILAFFIESSDFNGMPLRDVSREFRISYANSIQIVKKLVESNLVSIQSSTNPHIIGHKHHAIADQIHILSEAKNIKQKREKVGNIVIIVEETDYPICLYPSQSVLRKSRDVSAISESYYTLALALGEPQLAFRFFEIDVLDRYFKDPRYDFSFMDYSGRISCQTDESGNPILEEKDQVFLKTFGLGFDEENSRVAVSFVRYLSDMPKHHQEYWKSKEIVRPCKVLKEFYDNAINGEWSNSFSMFTGFIGELDCVYELTKLIFGQSLFIRSFTGENQPREFSLFFIPTLHNYNEFVSLLDKMLSDNISFDFFKGKIEQYEKRPIEDGVIERVKRGTIQLTEDWFSSNFKPRDPNAINHLFAIWKKVRKERQNPAHKIQQNQYDKVFEQRQRELISEAYNSMYNFRIAFQQHPSAAGFEVPSWLDTGVAKAF